VDCAITYVKHISNESISDDGDGTLPQRRTVEIVFRVERTAKHRETDESIEIEYDKAENSDPQQRFACIQMISTSYY